MGNKAGPVAVIVDSGPAVFGFLVENLGFEGPVLHSFPTPEPSARLVYDREDLAVLLSVHEGREPGVETHLSWREGTHTWRASLGILLVASGLGTRQDVPTSARNGRLALQRLDAQSQALRSLLAKTPEADLRLLVRAHNGQY